jgi:hypothetical protein
MIQFLCLTIDYYSDRIVASGGASHSKAILQTVADVFGCDVFRESTSSESAALGLTFILFCCQTHDVLIYTIFQVLFYVLFTAGCAFSATSLCRFPTLKTGSTTVRVWNECARRSQRRPRYTAPECRRSSHWWRQ